VALDVGDPQPVRGVGDEPALHQVGVHGRRRAGPVPFAPVTDPGQAGAARRISRATRLRPHAGPRPRRSPACTRGAPHVPREAAWTAVMVLLSRSSATARALGARPSHS
jgi:hypothetical protein